MALGPDGKGRDCKSQARKYSVRPREAPPKIWPVSSKAEHSPDKGETEDRYLYWLPSLGCTPQGEAADCKSVG